MSFQKFLLVVLIILFIFSLAAMASIDENGDVDFSEKVYIETIEYISVSYNDEAKEYECTYIDNNKSVKKNYFYYGTTSVFYDETLDKPYSYYSYKERFSHKYDFVQQLYVNDLSLIMQTNKENP